MVSGAWGRPRTVLETEEHAARSGVPVCAGAWASAAPSRAWLFLPVSAPRGRGRAGGAVRSGAEQHRNRAWRESRDHEAWNPDLGRFVAGRGSSREERERRDGVQAPAEQGPGPPRALLGAGQRPATWSG